MSTDLRDRTRHPSPDEGGGAAEKPKPALSFTQVVGGALAAMTAAALGSRLSVAGTVVGAALASVVAAVAGALYTASLRRTTSHVTKVIQKTRTNPGAQDEGTTTVPTWDATDDPADEPAWPTQVLPAVETATGPTTTDGRSRISWKPVLVGAVLIFAVAALALTGLELATGHPLSGGTGTTVGQVAERRAEPSSQPADADTASPSPTRKASATPSATPSSTPSSEPTAAPSSSASAEPSATPTATPTATPSAFATPVPSGASTPETRGLVR